MEDRFNRLSRDHGWAPANRAISQLRSVYRRPCVDFEGLPNPVDLWLAGGGEYHPPRRRKISTPAEVLPRWRAGIEAVVVTPGARDAFHFGHSHIETCVTSRQFPTASARHIAGGCVGLSSNLLSRRRSRLCQLGKV